MVFENILLKNVFKKKYVFPLTVLYSLISIIIARLIFGSNSGIVSVVFLSIFLIPSMRQILQKEKEIESKEKKFSLKKLFKNNKNIFEIYFLIFIAVFFTYLLSTFLLPQLGINIFNVFKEQLFLDPAIRGNAFSTSTFWSILNNNWIVLIVCFLLGIMIGDGAIFFIAWNASAWGTIFGYRALAAGIATNSDPWVFLWLLLIIIIWHTIIEAAAYILAAISGSTISKEIISDTQQKKNFFGYFIIGGILTFFLINLTSFNSKFTSFLMSTAIFLTWIYLMKLIFKDKKHEMVFNYNYWLLIIAIIVFVLGVVVETFVLSYSTTLMKIYSYSFLI